MKQNLWIAFSLLLVCAGVASYLRWDDRALGPPPASPSRGQRVQPGQSGQSFVPDSIELTLSAQPLPGGGDNFSLRLSRHDGEWLGEASSLENGVVTQIRMVRLTGEESERLLQGLQRCSGWRQAQVDDEAPEQEVLYTHLQLQSGPDKFISDWRGLPAEQREVAEIFLETPVGPAIQQAIEKLSRQKRR